MLLRLLLLVSTFCLHVYIFVAQNRLRLYDRIFMSCIYNTLTLISPIQPTICRFYLHPEVSDVRIPEFRQQQTRQSVSSIFPRAYSPD